MDGTRPGQFRLSRTGLTFLIRRPTSLALCLGLLLALPLGASQAAEHQRRADPEPGQIDIRHERHHRSHYPRHHREARPSTRERRETKPKAPAAPPKHKVTRPEPKAKPRVVPPPPAPAPKPAEESVEPRLPVPRFVSLKTDDTNMRRGPGQRYPIEWVYKRRGLPVEVEREYDVWRYVRDPDGIEGWMHEVTLSERQHTFIVQGADATIRESPDDKAEPVAILKVGVIGRFRSCPAGSQWCEVEAGGYRGYLRRDQVWGLLPNQVITP
jgi:SH3-like domain-containing protein